MTKKTFERQYERCRRRFEELKKEYPQKYDSDFEWKANSYLFSVLTYSVGFENEHVWTSAQIETLFKLLDEYRSMDLKNTEEGETDGQE